MGAMREAISLGVPNRSARADQVVKQIEMPRSPDPIMRRPCADCEEKRVIRGATEPKPENAIRSSLRQQTRSEKACEMLSGAA